MPNAWEFTREQCQYGSIFGHSKIRYSIAHNDLEAAERTCPICGAKFQSPNVVTADLRTEWGGNVYGVNYWGMELAKFTTCNKCTIALLSGDSDNPIFVKCDNFIAKEIAKEIEKKF